MGRWWWLGDRGRLALQTPLHGNWQDRASEGSRATGTLEAAGLIFKQNPKSLLSDWGGSVLKGEAGGLLGGTTRLGGCELSPSEGQRSDQSQLGVQRGRKEMTEDINPACWWTEAVQGGVWLSLQYLWCVTVFWACSLLQAWFISATGN